MADGLLGLDPAQIQALVQQFGPSEEDKKAARNQALMALGLGMMGAPKGGEWQRIGASGLNALNQYQGDLRNASILRGQAIAQGMGALKTAKETALTDAGLKILTGGAPGPANPTQLGGSPADAGAPPTVGTPAGGAPPGGVPSWANPQSELAMGLMGKKDIADIIHRQYQVTQGPGGTLIRNGQIVGQVLPNAGMVVDGKFQALPKEATDALVQFNAASKGAETAATEAAQQPYRTTTTQGPNGPISGYTNSVYGPPSLGGAAMPPPKFNGLTPAQEALARADAARSQDQGRAEYAQYRNGSGVVLGPDPVKQAGAKSEAEGMGTNYAKQGQTIDDDAKAAKMLASRLDEMDAQTKKFNSGMGKEAMLNVARAALAAGVPKDVADKIAGGDVAAMQVFRKHSVQMAFEAARQQMGGVPRAVQEIQFQMEANPSITLEPAANKAIMDYMRAVAKFQEQKQKAKDAWLDSNQTMRGFEGYFNRTNSVEEFNAAFDKSHPLSVGSPSESAVEAELRRRGMIK